MEHVFAAARTQALYEEALSNLNARFPLIIPRYVDQFAALMLQADREGHSLSVKAAAVRDAGRQCTAEEKRSFGVSVRQKLGWDFARAVTPLALTNPIEAGRAIANAGAKTVERVVQAVLCRHDGTLARLVIRDDDRTCAAARPLIAGILEVDDVPVFPLPTCDKWTCRCSLNRYADWMGGRFI